MIPDVHPNTTTIDRLKQYLDDDAAAGVSPRVRSGAARGGECAVLTIELARMPSIRTGFTTKLFRYPGKGGWTFAVVPPRHAPPVMHRWGRSTVIATVDGHTWKTSVWREKSGRTLLAVPKAVRGEKGDGDTVKVQLEFSL